MCDNININSPPIKNCYIYNYYIETYNKNSIDINTFFLNSPSFTPIIPVSIPSSIPINPVSTPTPSSVSSPLFPTINSRSTFNNFGQTQKTLGQGIKISYGGNIINNGNYNIPILIRLGN